MGHRRAEPDSDPDQTNWSSTLSIRNIKQKPLHRSRGYGHRQINPDLKRSWNDRLAGDKARDQPQIERLAAIHLPDPAALAVAGAVSSLRKYALAFANFPARRPFSRPSRSPQVRCRACR